jgi:hypothetical protein
MGTPTWEAVIAQLATLQQQNVELRQEIEASRHAATASERRPALRLKEPDMFGADATVSVRTWLFSLESYLTAVGVDDDKQRIEHSVTLFRGAALEWWRQLQSSAQVVENAIALPTTWVDFTALVRGRFEIISANRTARQRLRNFRQYGSVAAYTRDFLAVCAEIDDLSAAELCDRYIAGLRQEIAEALALLKISDNDFNGLVAAA